jgi:hypothetical protein
VPQYSFLNPSIGFPLPRRFDFSDYIETEREFWALFPETEGKRVNFSQTGLTAKLYVEADDDGSALQGDETYFLMPCEDRNLRPIRMQSARRLTLDEFRMTHLTAIRLMGKLSGTGAILDEVHLMVLGQEVLDEAAGR